MPSAAYPAARQRVQANLLECSWVFVLDPAPSQQIVPPAAERLAEIQVPTLIVVGDDDALFLHQIAERLEQGIAQTTRVGITETHHMPNIEKPEEFNSIVLAFLRAL